MFLSLNTLTQKYKQQSPWFGCLILVTGLLLSGFSAATELDSEITVKRVSHLLSYPQNKQQYLEVRSEFQVSSPSTDVVMPNWTPGAYVIKNFASNVDRLAARSASGDLLSVEKISKDTWRVQTQDVQTLVVDYEVHTPTLSVQTSWVEPAFSLINGASVFLYTDETKTSPQSLRIVTGQDRGDVFTALPMAEDGVSFLADNYDELVDSPVVVAKAPAYRFAVEGQDYVFVNVGENASWDASGATDDLQRLVEVTQKFWGVNPLTRPYWFLNLSVGAKGGLEHDHSTVTMTGRNTMQIRGDYVKWLGLMSHEFFHAWNVRRMRPVALQSYDYQNEQYTEQLWLAEGLTSYYDNVLLSRARLITPAEYLDLLAKDMHRLLNTPGRKLRPLTEASLDAWSRHYVRNANTLNSTVSYYNKGAVIGFVLDAYLREHSKDGLSLDDLMRRLYQRHSTEGYSQEQFYVVLAEVGGDNAVRFLEPLLDSTQDPDVDTALDWYGLEIRRNTDSAQDEQALPAVSGFGVIWENTSAMTLVKAVRADSAGAKAGLLPGDEILAIGDERMMRENYATLMEVFHPGESTTLMVSRRGQIKTLALTLDTALPDRYVIAVQKRISRRQLNQLEAFLGQDL